MQVLNLLVNVKFLLLPSRPIHRFYIFPKIFNRFFLTELHFIPGKILYKFTRKKQRRSEFLRFSV